MKALKRQFKRLFTRPVKKHADRDDYTHYDHLQVP